MEKINWSLDTHHKPRTHEQPSKLQETVYLILSGSLRALDTPVDPTAMLTCKTEQSEGMESVTPPYPIPTRYMCAPHNFPVGFTVNLPLHRLRYQLMFFGVAQHETKSTVSLTDWTVVAPKKITREN